MPRRHFINLNSPAGPLPGILTIPAPGGLHFGRVIHAELDHYAPPLTRRPPPYEHEHYHIVLVTSGKGAFEIAGRLWPAEPGLAFFTSPRQPHQFANAAGETTRYTEVTFKFLRRDGQALALDFGEMLSAWTNLPCSEVVSHRFSPGQAGVLAGRIAALVNRGRATPRPDDLELGALLAEILLAVFRDVFRGEAEAPPDKIDRVRDLIQARCRDELHLTALARQAGLSPSHLSRRFKARFGRSPIDYQLELRLRGACELLRTRDEPLSAIAAAVGFDDVYYFSRLFRRRLGESPGRFRRSLRPPGGSAPPVPQGAGTSARKGAAGRPAALARFAPSGQPAQA